MIKKRKKSGVKELEYYLLVKKENLILYNDWYSSRELIEIAAENGINLSYGTLYARIANKNNSKFRTLKGCVFTESQHPTGNGETGSVAYYTEEDYFEWIELMRLWPAGSLSNQARVMQSVSIVIQQQERPFGAR